jgi:beta-lactamase superfamily II metal-dependent hydrolase
VSILRVTLIDVGWGDSIFLETSDQKDKHHYALIDSNDSPTLRSSYIFVQRFFEKKYAKQNLKLPDPKTQPLFDWVLLTHAHGDHAEGLKRLLQGFGAAQFWYPNTKLFQPTRPSVKPQRPVYLAALLRFVKRSKVVKRYRTVDAQTRLAGFGNVVLKVLWPPPSHNSSNENNNSVVLALTLGHVSFVLTGDAEADAWNSVSPGQTKPLHSFVPPDTKFFKVPHHGAENGMFDFTCHPQTPWLNALSSDTKLGISSHVQPFPHPSPSVIDEIKRKKLECYRTDLHYHVTVCTDGTKTWMEYNH